MQIGINLWVWGAPITDDRIADRVPQAAEMGFDTIEFPLEEPEGFDYETSASLLSEHDLDATVVAAVNEQRDLLHDDPAVRETGREYIRASVDAAATVGADCVAGPLYSAVGRTWKMTAEERDRAYDDVAEQLAELADYADDHGVSLCVEPLNRFETSVVNTVQQGVELVDRVDHRACDLLLDTFHMNVEETSIPRAIRLAGDRIGHFHACGNDRGAPGNGHIDWTGVADALDDVGYDDHAVIESFTPEVESIAEAAAIWRPLEDSQDDLAVDGLAVLRDRFER